jgi:hypothetical protein
MVGAAGTVQYIGSFLAKCQASACRSELDYSFEPTEAQAAIADSPLAGVPFRAEPVVAYGDAPAPALLAGLGPLAVTVAEPPVSVQPDWSTFRDDEAKEAGTPVANVLGHASGNWVLVTFPLVLAVAAVERSVDRSEDESVREKYAPCMPRLEAAVSGALSDGALADLIAHDVSGRTGAQDTAAAALEVSLQRVGLQRCAGAGRMCVEVAARARLTERATGAVLDDHTFLYTSRSRISEQPLRLAVVAGYPRHSLKRLPHEVETATSSECLHIDAYCGEGGSARLKADVAAGLQQISQEIAARYGRAD